MSRRVLINLIFFSLVFVGFLGWAVRNIVTIDAIEQPYSLAGDFEAAAGVLPNAEVSYLGVRYGRVSSVDLREGGVRIHMKIDKEKEVPETATANIFRKSAVGEPYILLVPAEGYAGGGPFLAEGAVIPEERTTVPLEFSEMLRSASRLVGSIDAEAAGNVVHELSLALAGRSEALRQITLAGDTLSKTFDDRTETLDRLATNNTRLTRVVAEHRGSLGDAIGDLRQVADTLRRAEGDLTRLLDEGSDLAGRTATIVSNQKGNIDCILSDLEGVLRTANKPEHLVGLETVLTVGPTAFEGVWDSRDEEPDGVWLRVGLVNNPSNPTTQYVPPKPIPTVREVPPCGSGLVAASGSYTPRPASVTSQPTIPATGGDAALTLGILLAAAGVVLRWSMREDA